METEITEFIKKKIEFYDLMSMIFMREPTGEFSRVLMEVLKEDYFPFEAESEIIGRLHMQIKEYFSQKSSVDFAKELKQEWYTLFFNPYGLKASPWQSSYTNHDHLLYQAPNHEAKNFYIRYQYKVTNDALPGDHISTELEFLKKLAEQEYSLGNTGESGELEAVLKDNISFIDCHLLSWINEFIHQLSENESFFYCKFAAMVKEAGCLDRAFLSKYIKNNQGCKRK